MNIETKVYEVINERIDTMKTLDPTSAEYKANMEAALKFIDRAADFEKIHIEEEANQTKFNFETEKIRIEEEKIHIEEKANQTKLDFEKEKLRIEEEKIRVEEEANKIRLRQMEDDLKDRKTRNWLTALSIVVPPLTAVVAACVFSVVERTEIVRDTAPREFLKRALRLS